MRKLTVVMVAALMAGCQAGGGGADPAQEQAAPSAQAQQQVRQLEQQTQELEGQLQQRQSRIGELEERVSALQDSLARRRAVPSQLVDGGMIGCTDWAQDSDYVLCTTQSLASK